MRRPRSRSPDGFRRSPPPSFKRHRRDDDRFDGPYVTCCMITALPYHHTQGRCTATRCTRL